MQTAVFFAPGFEEIEALTVVDILRRASIDVLMVSVSDSLMVTGSHAIAVSCDAMFQEVDFAGVDMLILPGGMPGAAHLSKHDGLRAVLKNFNDMNLPIAAICAAPFILGDMKMLQGRRAVCFPGFEQHLAGAHLTENLVVVDKNIITAKGAGAAMAFAFEIVEFLRGKSFADELAAKMIFAR